MKFNTKIRYGLRAMIEIAINNDANGILQKDIADKQDLSTKYLDHIIAPLKIAALIKNSGGKRSGYILSRPDSEITTLDIFKAFDHDFVSIDCLSEDKSCIRNNSCTAKNFWNRLNCNMEEFLGSVTLEELKLQELESRKDKEDSAKMMYHI